MKKLTLLILILTFSCGNNNSNTKKWTASDLNCGKAEITEVLGNNSYFGGGNDIIVKCKVEFDDSEFDSELIIDVSIIGEAHCPFKAGDIVAAKFLKSDRQRTVEMYLLESVNNRTGYKWVTIYSFEEACSGNWPEGCEQQKVFSARGKI